VRGSFEPNHCLKIIRLNLLDPRADDRKGKGDGVGKEADIPVCTKMAWTVL
jgi:hypothetical protein